MVAGAALFLAPFGALLLAGLLANATVGPQDGETLAFRAAGAPPWRAGDDAWRDWLGEALTARELAHPVGPLHRWPDKLRWGHRPRRHVDVLRDGGGAVRVTYVEPSTAARLALLSSGTDGRVATALRIAGWLGLIGIVALPYLSARSEGLPLRAWLALCGGAAAATATYFAAL